MLATPIVAGAETVSLHQLLGGADRALSILSAEAEVAGAESEWQRERAEEGWKLSVATGFGSSRDIIDEQRTRSYEAVQTKFSLAYPLLGAYAKEQRKIEMAAGKLQEAKIKRDAAMNVARLEIEDVYAVYWGTQESLEVIAAYLGNEADGGDSDSDGLREARTERRRLTRRRNEALSRLERLAGTRLENLVAMSVQLPTMPTVDLKRLQLDYPELAALRSEHASTREQLDDSVWWSVDATFDITQTTTTDYDGGQAGNGLFANFNITMPLAFFAAGTHERRRLHAEMEVLELKIQEVVEDVTARARDALTEHEDTLQEVESLRQRTQTRGRALRESGQGRREYLQLALDELDARTRYWRSHVAVRSFIPVGAAEPAPEPTGPETSDVGTRLAEPLIRSRRGG